MTQTEATNAKSKGSAGRRARQRRKEARPAEIIQAALTIFGERGFAASRMEDVARRAGVSKGTLFVYFQNKEDLFRAVAKTVLSTHLNGVGSGDFDFGRPLAELVPALLAQFARIGRTGLPAIARLVVTEARTFPDLAQVWHDEVASKVLGLLTIAIKSAQARGEIRPGNARLHAFSIMGPMMAAVLFREVFQDTGAALPDLEELARQHTATVLGGLLVPTQ